MTRPRRQRARTESDVIAALRSGAAVDWSPANWDMLKDAWYFSDHDLTDAQKKRAGKLMDEWRPRQEFYQKR